MKNILIMGIGRAGKTTLSKMLKDKINSYNLIHSDSLKWAMIRAKNEEKYFRENVDKQKEFEHGEYFQRTLLEFFKSSMSKDKKNYGCILESGQLHPRIVKEMVNFDNTIVVCLGLGDFSLEDMVNLCIEHDTPEDWTYGLSREYLREHAKDWFTANEMLKKECPKYGIKYYDTSKNRVETLDKIMNEILELV